MAASEDTQSPLSEEDVERLTAMLTYQSAIAGQTVGLPEARTRELAEAVVRTVEALAAKWAEASNE
jgi:hypothetical protein